MKQIHSSRNKFKTLNDLCSQEPVWRNLENFFGIEVKVRKRVKVSLSIFSSTQNLWKSKWTTQLIIMYYKIISNKIKLVTFLLSIFLLSSRENARAKKSWREKERIFYAKLSESRSGEKVRFNNNELWRDKKMVALVGKWNNTTDINYTQLRCIQWIAITCSPLRKSERGNASLHKFACLRIQLFLSKILFLSFF